MPGRTVSDPEARGSIRATVKLEGFESLGFKAKLAALMAASKITERALMLDRHYATSEQPDGVFCVYARA